MKYVYIALAVILLLLIILLICWCLRKRWARKQVCLRTDERKCLDLNAALETFGFAYDMCGDYFYSLMHPWQRELGYCRFYDESAPMLNMVIDCEPIYFDCEGRSYLLEVWKGQYGMSTGAEIGFYVSRESARGCPEKLFYESVTDDERLNMCFVLRKHGRAILERADCHWWLTGFLLGEFSHRDELTMEVRITFPDAAMRNAFYEGLIRAGYQSENIWVDCLTVAFYFTEPKCRNRIRHCRLRIWWIQWKNRRNCRIYLRVTRCFIRTLDKVTYLGLCFPRLYRLAVCIGKTKSMRIGFKRIKRRKVYGNIR